PPEGGRAPGVPGGPLRHRLHRPAPRRRQGRPARARRRRGGGAPGGVHDGGDRRLQARQGARHGRPAGRGGERRPLEELRPAQADARRPVVKYEVREKGGETRTVELKELGEDRYEARLGGSTVEV